MKKVFYKTLLNRGKNITANERILYSFLVSKSIMDMKDVFDIDGKTVNSDALLVMFDYYNNHIPLCKMSNRRISLELGVTRKSVIVGLRHLCMLGYIFNDNGEDLYIYANRELLEHGFFELLCDKGISGELLIFYSYLADKARQYGGLIDTYKDRIANDLGKTKVSVTKLLNRLYKLGLAERREDGSLFINV